MATRRDFLKAGALAGAGAFIAKGVGSPEAYAAAGAPKLKKFVDPLLAAIPVLKPDPEVTAYDYYEVYMKPGKFQFHSQLPVTATQDTTWGYGSNYKQGGDVFLGYLGPTIEARKGRRVRVKFKNLLPNSAGSHPLNASIDPTVPAPDMYPGLVDGRAVPHLHGGFTDPRYDGHPHSWYTKTGGTGSHYATLPGGSPGEAILEYSNEQVAAMLWYHDHAMGITRLNVYAGLAGLYFVRDNYDTGETDNPLGLPAKAYEIPLVLQDKQFNPDGSLFYPTTSGLPFPTYPHPVWIPEFFGDTPVVNGRAYPYLAVEPRRYRFRVVNGSQARFYNFWFNDPVKGPQPFYVIGMEQSLIPGTPGPVTRLVLAPGERADIIVDFAKVAPGTTLTMMNNAKTPYPGGRGGTVPQIMQFRVTMPLTGADSTADPSSGQWAIPAAAVPPALRPNVTPAMVKRNIVMKETMNAATGAPEDVRLNGKWFDDGSIDETPTEGATEVWQFINLTVDAHPMHLHLVQFQVLNRQAFNVAGYTTAWTNWKADPVNNPEPLLSNYLLGAPIPPLPEEMGWKDTARSMPGEVLRVVMKFDLPPAPVDAFPPVTGDPEYVYHCHILEHEENEMMRPFTVTKLGKKSVGEDQVAENEPASFRLHQNYPNPFNPETTIRFQLPSDSHVQLRVYNSIGQEVASLADGQFAAGSHSVTFNANNLASGVYYYKIHAGTFTATEKMILMR